MTYINGDVYQGEWLEGIKAGKGKHSFFSGDFYEGEFQAN